MLLKNDYYWMQRTIDLAQKALPEDVPIGALVLNSKGELLSEAFNRRQANYKLSAHAEILALDEACQKLQNWRLNNCILYVTLEPCLMCAGAIIQSRLKKVIFGAFEEDNGASIHLSKAGIQVIGGLMEKKCLELLKKFFKNLRITPNT